VVKELPLMKEEQQPLMEALPLVVKELPLMKEAQQPLIPLVVEASSLKLLLIFLMMLL
jgi:hypothetical protein